MQKTNQKEFRIEKVIKRKADKLCVKWKGCNSPFNSWIDKKDIVQMSQDFPKPNSLGANVKVELNLSNYATKTDIKNATGADTSSCAKKIDLASSKSDVNKLDIDDSKNIPTNLSNLKSKVDKLDVDKLVPVPVDLSKLSDVVKNDVVEKDVYNAKMKNIEGKVPDNTNLPTNASLNAKINEVKGEIPSITNLTTTAALTIVENKIPNVSNLVKKTVYNTKTNEIEKKITDHDHSNKYITTPKFNKLTAQNFATRLKQANLASKSDITNLVNKTDFDNKLLSFNKRINSNKTKHVLAENELNELSKKVKLLSTKDYSFFLGRIYFTNDDGLQNMFVYQPTYNVIKYLNTSTEYITSWRSKGVYNAKLIPIKNHSLPNIKYFNKKIALQFDYTPLVVEQNNYTPKIVNVFIVFDLDYWPKIPLRNFTLRNCLSGVTNIVKNSDREKYLYSGYGIAFDGKGSWSFSYEFARNVIIFGVDNSFLSHADSLKYDFLILGEGDPFGFNGSFGAPEKKLEFIFLKQRQSFV